MANLQDVLAYRIVAWLSQRPALIQSISEFIGVWAMFVRHVVTGRFHKSMIERAASEQLKNNDLSQKERSELAEDLSIFQFAMDEIIAASSKCDKQSVIIAISKAFIIGLQAPQSEETVAAIRAAATSEIGRLVGEKMAEIAKAWHLDFDRIAVKCPSAMLEKSGTGNACASLRTTGNCYVESTNSWTWARSQSSTNESDISC